MPQVDRPAPSILDDESERDLSPQNVTLDALKTFKCRHMLRIGALDILGHLTLQAATAVIVHRTRSAVVLVAQDFSPAWRRTSVLHGRQTYKGPHYEYRPCSSLRPRDFQR